MLPRWREYDTVAEGLNESPPKFVESELMSVKGRREGEDNGIGGGGVDDISE
jgi:hypothetical protein